MALEMPVTALVLAPGDEHVFSVRVSEGPGATIPGDGIAWRLEPEGVVAVTPAGPRLLEVRVRGLADGRAALFARAGSRSDSMTILVRSAPPARLWREIVAGHRHTCAREESDRWHCWGSAFGAALGDAELREYMTVLAPLRLEGSVSFERLAPGDGFVCGLTATAEVHCWGRAEDGALGTGATSGLHRRAGRVDIGEPAASVTAGTSMACALAVSGRRYCWGRNELDGLGVGHGAVVVASPVSGEDEPAMVDVRLGEGHGCGLGAEGRVFCWGANHQGQAGVAGADRVPRPAEISGGLRFVAIAAGFEHACGLTGSGEAYCWGSNAALQLGTPAVGMSPDPVRVDMDVSFDRIYAGQWSTCALTADGLAYCWGSNARGAAGSTEPEAECRIHQVSFPCSARPLPVSGGHVFAALSVGSGYACGLRPDGHLFCWGSNVGGRLGNGRSGFEPQPLPVRTADPVDA